MKPDKKLISQFLSCLNDIIDTAENTDGTYHLYNPIGYVTINGRKYQIQLTLDPQNTEWIENGKIAITREITTTVKNINAINHNSIN